MLINTIFGKLSTIQKLQTVIQHHVLKNHVNIFFTNSLAFSNISIDRSAVYLNRFLVNRCVFLEIFKRTPLSIKFEELLRCHVKKVTISLKKCLLGCSMLTNKYPKIYIFLLYMYIVTNKSQKNVSFYNYLYTCVF